MSRKLNIVFIAYTAMTFALGNFVFRSLIPKEKAHKNNISQTDTVLSRAIELLCTTTHTWHIHCKCLCINSIPIGSHSV